MKKLHFIILLIFVLYDYLCEDGLQVYNACLETCFKVEMSTL